MSCAAGLDGWFRARLVSSQSIPRVDRTRLFLENERRRARVASMGDRLPLSRRRRCRLRRRRRRATAPSDDPRIRPESFRIVSVRILDAVASRGRFTRPARDLPEARPPGAPREARAWEAMECRPGRSREACPSCAARRRGRRSAARGRRAVRGSRRRRRRRGLRGVGAAAAAHAATTTTAGGPPAGESAARGVAAHGWGRAVAHHHRGRGSSRPGIRDSPPARRAPVARRVSSPRGRTPRRTRSARRVLPTR